MAGGLVKYRHLSRNSAHRQALLRNLVTSLVKHEAIHTSWAKAKEAQRLAEKLITLAKRNNETSRRKATGILFVRAFSFLQEHVLPLDREDKSDGTTRDRGHDCLTKRNITIHPHSNPPPEPKPNLIHVKSGQEKQS
jgi:ribosomal protein L17